MANTSTQLDPTKSNMRDAQTFKSKNNTSVVHMGTAVVKGSVKDGARTSQLREEMAFAAVLTRGCRKIIWVLKRCE